MPSRGGRQNRLRRRRASADGASAKSLRMAKWMRGSRLPCASTSRCSSSVGDAFGAGEERRDDDHRARVVGHAVGEIEPGQAARRNGPRDSAAARRRWRCRARGRRAARASRAARARAASSRRTQTTGGREQGRRQRPRSIPDRAAWDARAPDAAHARAKRRPIGDVGFEIRAAGADEVIADVRGPVGRPSRAAAASRALSTALSASCTCASPLRRGDLLDRVALLVAAEEVHPAVDAGRIAPQGVLDQAHALDVLDASRSPSRAAGS